jgi:hypothetical protein
VMRRDGCYVLKETNHGEAFEDICSFLLFFYSSLFVLSISVSSRVFIVARQQRNVFPVVPCSHDLDRNDKRLNMNSKYKRIWSFPLRDG